MGSRHLAALMFTDMVGYSALAKKDEQLARELVEEHRAIIRRLLPLYGGQERQTTGDGFFVEFGSVMDAVECGIEIQTKLHQRELHLPAERRMKIRIGIHLSDIIADQDDAFGNGINIAARIEAMAPPGGICITRQVYDQIEGKIGIEVRKLGRKSLKNIQGGAELFHLIFPWENSRSSPLPRVIHSWQARFRRASINSMIIGTLFVSCLGILFLSMDMTWKGWDKDMAAATQLQRAPAGVAQDSSRAPTPRRLDLSKGWSYVLDSVNRSPEGLPGAPTKGWKDFNPSESWKYAGKIQGRYWLKKTFSVQYPFEFPAIVLGLIPDYHRVYLNGHFIGGSENSGYLSFYTFDPGLLNLNASNTLLVQGRARPSLNPGITRLADVGMFLGNFEDVRQTAMKNQIEFHVFRTVYLALSLAIFLACLGFAIFRRSHRHYLYCSLFLLLGSIHLSYYNPWVSSTLNYPFLRFLKTVALSLSPFVLFSTYLHLRRKYLIEAVNNGLALAALLGISGLLLQAPPSPMGFIELYNRILLCAAIYATAWVAYATWENGREWISKAFNRGLPSTRRRPSISFTFEGLSVLFGLCCALTLFSSLKAGESEILFSPLMRSWVQSCSLALPFAFALSILFAATVDYTIQSRTAARKKSRDQLVLGMIRLIHDSPDVSNTVSSIQERMCRFLKARRSTLYVLEEGKDGGDSWLRATYVLGDDHARREVKPAVRPNEGLIGYVLKHRSPLLIRDIRKDGRFADELTQKSNTDAPSSYRTGTCMLFPLISGSRLLGVLTLADKEMDIPFSRDDFAMALEVSTDLALLLDNRQLRESIGQKTGSTG